jgi:hypothetical protein
MFEATVSIILAVDVLDDFTSDRLEETFFVETARGRSV